MNVIYSITEHQSVQILSINSLLDEWQNRKILRELEQKIDKGSTKFVVDLSQLNLMNSSGLNFLLSLFSKTKKKNGALILANVSKRVRQVLDITKLSSIFSILPSIEHAVDSLSLELELELVA